MKTIDIKLSGGAVAAQPITKQSLMAQLSCSLSTIKRIIGLLDEMVPDEFGRHEHQRFYSSEQAQMILWVKSQLNEGYRYTHIEKMLEEGFPDV